MNPIRQGIQRKLRRVVVERRLTYAAVATRTGLHERTVERFLEGETFSDETAHRIALALRVDVQVDTEDTPESPFEELLDGLVLWRLRGVPGWWARVGDVAAWLGVGRAGFAQRLARAVRDGSIAREDLRHGQHDGDAIVAPRNIRLTSSPRGCTMIAGRAVLWLVLTSNGDRGERSLDVVVEELQYLPEGRR